MGNCKFKIIYFISSIDGTSANRLGNFVNDSSDGNCECQVVMYENIPHLCLFAKEDIEIGEELRYNYGEDKKFLWWRTEVQFALILQHLFPKFKIFCILVLKTIYREYEKITYWAIVQSVNFKLENKCYYVQLQIGAVIMII